MDRTLQSALEKRTRVGAWTTRVYRLERGYLSAWADVAKVAAKEEPSRTECLFQGNQVAKVIDQGDRKFKLEFPWDKAKSLQLRANTGAMKKSWMDVLKATIKEASAQIQGTGSVFAYGGAAHHEKDQAYEEAAFLQTNRFVAAYVVDEHSRMSYINDILNEGFQQPGERADGERELHRACVGANTAIKEFMALIQDFDDEMQGLEALRRDGGGGQGAIVAAPKIRRFCEGYLALVGRLIASRLMLELSPFMDSSVATTSSAPLSSSRQQLIATRQKLDEAYAAAEQHIVLGTRDWFMDIRGSLLDCEGLATMSSEPPRPTPMLSTQRDTEEDSPEISKPASLCRSSQAKLVTASSSARKADRDVTSSISSGLKAPEGENRGEAEQGRTGFGGWSMRSAFRRGSRLEKEEPSASSQSTPALKHGQDEFRNMGKSVLELAEDEGRERSSLFGVSSRSASKSPLSTRIAERKASPAPNENQSNETFSAASAAPLASGNDSPAGTSGLATQKKEGGRKSRRAFAGGLWGTSGDPAAKHASHGDGPRSSGGALAATIGAGPREEAVESIIAPAAVEQAPPSVRVPDNSSRGDIPASTVAKPSGGKRRFAGGGFSAPAAAAASASGSNTASRESGLIGVTAVPPVAAAGQSVPISLEKERASPPSAKSLPAWAARAGQDIPAWAADSKTSSVSSGSGGGRTAGFGVAPPSRGDQGQEAAGRSPFMVAEAPAPAPRRPSQKRGESGRAKRAFGGGQSLF